MIGPVRLVWRFIAAVRCARRGAALDENAATRFRLDFGARPALAAGTFANAMVLQRLLHIALLRKARRIGGVLTNRTGGKRPASGRKKPPSCRRCFSLPSSMRMENRLIVH
jgi:hypothetical protein